MSIKVSVVIPVYNPGKYIQPCIDSLLGQTLPTDEFEVLFVDDGSTDETPEELDRLAEKHPHFRVIHIPNSGWPGKPRNIGVAEARGEYVQFVDQDDHMASEALHRLYEMGHRNGSDIVIGKVASNFRGVPHGVFRTDRQKCTLRDAPLHDSLTPHKMFRRQFLLDNGIAYPEGKRRLEDQLYMMQAYFPAEVVSILGSYTCYYYSKRDDGKNAGSTRPVPAGYYGNLREVLDVVLENTEPGSFRDLLLRRFYRVEMLGRVSEPNVLRYEPEYLDEMLDSIRPLALEYMGDSVHDSLGALTRLRSTLVRNDDREALVEVARLAASIKGAARLEDVAWQPDGKLAVSVTARLTHGDDGEPLKLLRRSGRVLVHPDLTRALLDEDTLIDVTDELGDFRAEMSLRNRETAVEWPCQASFEPEFVELGDDAFEVVLRGTGLVAPQGEKKRGPVSRGFWDVWVPVRGLGLVRKARVGADRAPHVDADCRPAQLGATGRPVIPYFTEGFGNLTLDVGRRDKRLSKYLADRPVRRVPGRRVELQLDVFTTARSGTRPVQLELGSLDGRTFTVEAQLRPFAGRAHLALPALPASVAPGPWSLAARLDRPSDPATPLCEVRVGKGGRVRVGEVPPVDPAAAREIRISRAKAAARSRLAPLGGPVLRRLPAPARKRIRRLASGLVG
ncbi:glycosyltransferase [Streptomyces sp. NPDC060194]|uniref:glycosyltransferase family 2 protein n=1 Tax=Streptomyces sp. NPDC060194 TaxID=3347069 RepID=UPI003654E9C8